MFFNSEERKIKKAIFDRAKAMAKESYQKDVMFRTLQASELHYAIIQDLMVAAKYTGSVVVELKDGTKINFVSKEQDPRSRLEELDRMNTF